MIQRDLLDEIRHEKLDTMSFHMVKYGMSLIIIKVHEEKSCRVSPNVASNFFEPASQTTSRVKLLISSRA